MADLAQLQSWLTEAEGARHRLAIGSQEEEVEHADMRTRFTRSDLAKLDNYIASLKSQIAALGGTVTGGVRRAIEVNL